MSRVFHALTAEPWCIEPSWLPFLAALAQRDMTHPDVLAKGDWKPREFELSMASGSVSRLSGARTALLSDGVAIIPIIGPIFPRASMMTDFSGATAISTLKGDLQAAMANDEVRHILLSVDSPGGQVSGIASFVDDVQAAGNKKPITAHVSGTGASAAYWIASAAKEISLDRTGMVGSIGAVAAMSKQVAPDGDGMIDVEIVSSNAPNKRPDPTSEGGYGEIRAVLDAVEEQFIADVAAGRKTTVEKVIANFGQGGMKVGAAAMKAKMVDRMESMDQTMSRLHRTVSNQRRLAALSAAA